MDEILIRLRALATVEEEKRKAAERKRRHAASRPAGRGIAVEEASVEEIE